MTSLEGIVTKAGVMGKTVTVTVSRKVVHPILLKEMKRHKKFLVHDEHEQARLDDRVTIQLGKPQSKRKSFYLTQIHSRGSALVAPPSSSSPTGGVAPEKEESEILKQVELAEKAQGVEGFEKQERRRKEEEREREVLEKMGIQGEKA